MAKKVSGFPQFRWFLVSRFPETENPENGKPIDYFLDMCSYINPTVTNKFLRILMIDKMIDTKRFILHASKRSLWLSSLAAVQVGPALGCR